LLFINAKHLPFRRCGILNIQRLAVKARTHFFIVKRYP